MTARPACRCERGGHGRGDTLRLSSSASVGTLMKGVCVCVCVSLSVPCLSTVFWVGVPCVIKMDSLGTQSTCSIIDKGLTKQGNQRSE